MATDRSNPAAIEIELAGTDGDQVATVTVRGDLDAVAAPGLREALADVIDRSPVVVRIDMAGVDFLDSVGISVLVASFNQATDAGVAFELASVPASSRRVLEITRLTDVLTIVD